MDTSNWRLTQGASGAMEFGDWRAQLQRKRTVNKIMDTLKSRLPFSGYEILQELKKVAERVEEEIYTASTNQSEYTRKICFMMLTMETRLQNPIRSNSAASLNNSVNGGDWQEEVYQKIKDMKDLYLLESGDWRAQLQADSREKIRNKLMDALKRRLPFSGHEGLQELKKITATVEEKIYSVATSQSDYLRNISLKMLTMETGSQYPMLSNSAGSHMMQQVNNQGQQLPILVPSNNIQPMMSESMHTNIGLTGMQGSYSLSFALPPGSSLHQPTMTGVAGQSSSLQNIPNMSNVQQSQLIGRQNNYYDTQQMVQQQTQGASGAVSMESGDWRAQLQTESRQRIANKILDTLKRHLPYSGDEGLQELKKIAERFEEKIYAAAISQSDYLRKISLKMLEMETRSQNPMLSNSAGRSL